MDIRKFIDEHNAKSIEENESFTNKLLNNFMEGSIPCYSSIMKDLDEYDKNGLEAEDEEKFLEYYMEIRPHLIKGDNYSKSDLGKKLFSIGEPIYKSLRAKYHRNIENI